LVTFQPIGAKIRLTISLYIAVGNYTAGNIFTAQLSNLTGSFSSPTTIGTLTAAVSGTIIGTIPNTVVLENGYLIRVI